MSSDGVKSPQGVSSRVVLDASSATRKAGSPITYPDHPAHPLVFLRRLSPCALEQNSKAADGHGEADKDSKARSRLGAVSAQVAIGCQHQRREEDTDDRQQALEPTPFAIGLVVRRAHDEEQESDIADGLG